MKTSKALLATILIAAGILSAPAVHAQDMRKMEVAFTYRPGDSAKEIYHDLQRTARQACQVHGVRALYLKKYQRTCEKKVIENGVARLNRADVAAIHTGVYAGNDTRG